MPTHDEEQFGLVDGTVPKLEENRRFKRMRYCIGLCMILFFIILILFVTNLKKISGLKEDDTNISSTDENVAEEDNVEEDTLHLFKQDYHMFIASNNYSVSGSGLKLDKAVLTESAMYCDEETVNALPDVERRIKRADCGMGYNYLNSAARTKPWKVMFYGNGWTHGIVDLLGCPIGNGRCPLSPKCSIEVAPTGSPTSKLEKADLILIFQKEADALVDKLPEKEVTLADGTKKRIYRVFYWREAQWTGPSRENQLKFDFEIGVHFRSGIPDPYFFSTPREYLSLLGGAALGRLNPNIPSSKERVHFAMSIISHCNADSMRDQYQKALISYLGEERVHRFGKCGNRALPTKPLNNAFRIITQYKFYFSFENEIQDQYVTEKLLFILGMAPIPVYYGSLNPPNITTSKSYIEAASFSSIKDLAQYLLYLDKNPEAYNEYHTWKTDWSLFHQDYLDMMENRVSGPKELLVHLEHHFQRYPRTSQCCRICDENYVKYATSIRPLDKTIGQKWSKHEVLKRFFKTNSD